MSALRQNRTFPATVAAVTMTAGACQPACWRDFEHLLLRKIDHSNRGDLFPQRIAGGKDHALSVTRPDRMIGVQGIISHLHQTCAIRIDEEDRIIPVRA